MVLLMLINLCKRVEASKQQAADDHSRPWHLHHPRTGRTHIHHKVSDGALKNDDRKKSCDGTFFQPYSAVTISTRRQDIRNDATCENNVNEQSKYHRHNI